MSRSPSSDAPPEPWPEDVPYVAAEQVNWPDVQPDAADVFLMGFVGAGVYVGLSLTGRSPTLVLAVTGTVVVAAAAFAWSFFRKRRRTTSAVLFAQIEGTPVWEAEWTGSCELLESPWRLGPRLPRIVAGAVFFACLAGSTLLREREVFGAFLVGGPAVLLAVVTATRTALRGRLQVRLDSFPLRTGSTVVLHLATTPGRARLRDVQVLLRCAQGVRIGRRVWYATKWRRVVALPSARWPGPDDFVGVEFDLPADAPGTSLFTGTLVRWEVVVAAKTSWGRFLETVLLPVYAPDASNSDAAT